jgi:cyclic pyranopterin phosphate synthase
LLFDNCGRPALNLRISLTQRCNLKCVYCHREGQVPSSALPEMTAEEVLRIAQMAVSLGMTRIKLTGGEPLLRSDILDIVKGLAAIPGLSDLAMTTNGTSLSVLAQPLKEAGLMRVNINFPSLDKRTYSMVNGGNLNEVLSGIGAAVKAGFHPVKLNTLVLRDINIDAIPKMIEFARQNQVILQLIELEPINIKDDFYIEHYFSLETLEEDLRKKALEIQTRGDMQNRHIYTLPGVKVEVVHPIENTDFCARCTRLRVTSDGKLKPCLMVNDNLVDVLTPIRNGATEKELKELFIAAVKKREPYYKPLKKN